MRRAVTHREEAAARARQGRRDMVEKWDGRRVAALFAEEFLRQLEAVSAPGARQPVAVE